MPARAPISPPRPAPVRTGLVGAVGRTEIPAERWQWGVTYRPRRYDSGRSFQPQDCDPQTLTVDPPPDIVNWDAWAIWWGERCDAVRPDSFDELRADAAANLELHQSHLIEQTFWSGQVGGAPMPAPNVGLATTGAADLLAGGANVGVIEGWRLLLAYLATTLAGARGIIHVPHEATALLDHYGLIRREGTLTVAASADHLVVPGTGYTGSGPGDVLPGGNDRWFYATSPVEVRVGPVDVTWEPVDTLDRAADTVDVRASQPVIAHWDRQAHGAVRVCLEDPGPLCAGS